MNPTETIQKLRQLYGEELAIVGHHYQTDDVIRHCDIVGDSLELARRVQGLAAKHIVFCGVYFMAESAAVLASPEQVIHIPDHTASCVMSDMAPGLAVEAMLERLHGMGRKVTPLAYVNTSAAVKAVVGRYGGAVCTSANAPAMLRWAYQQGDGVLFLPDKNLGHNTADILGVPEGERFELDIRTHSRGLTPQQATPASLFLWPGLCVIHHRFKAAHVDAARAEHPDARVLVHPECTPEVVRMADGAGSTSYLIKQVEEAPQGATLVIGTEISLVRRLAAQQAGHKTVLPLAESQCANMAKITEHKLATTLQQLEEDHPITVEPHLAEPGRAALTRMLEACS